MGDVDFEECRESLEDVGVVSHHGGMLAHNKRWVKNIFHHFGSYDALVWREADESDKNHFRGFVGNKLRDTSFSRTDIVFVESVSQRGDVENQDARGGSVECVGECLQVGAIEVNRTLGESEGVAGELRVA